jgi:hypothetical protein
MGGFGSGRSEGRPTVEDSLTHDLRRLFKTGWLKGGCEPQRQISADKFAFKPGSTFVA